MAEPIFIQDGFYGSAPGRLIGRTIPTQSGVSGLQWSAVSEREVTDLPAPVGDGEGGYIFHGYHSMFVDALGTIQHEKETYSNDGWGRQVSEWGGP